ncbi:MAG: hypothetical protein NVS1B6_08550 [Steroidobacteraceae bacterium]
MEDEGLDLRALAGAIVRRREALGWTTHRLAQRCRVGDPYLRQLETGTTSRVGIDILVRIARALSVPLDELLRESGVNTGTETLGNLSQVYVHLNEAERRAWLRMGHILGELQETHAQLERGGDADNVVPFFVPPGIDPNQQQAASQDREWFHQELRNIEPENPV